MASPRSVNLPEGPGSWARSSTVAASGTWSATTRCRCTAGFTAPNFLRDDAAQSRDGLLRKCLMSGTSSNQTALILWSRLLSSGSGIRLRRSPAEQRPKKRISGDRPRRLDERSRPARGESTSTVSRTPAHRDEFDEQCAKSREVFGLADSQRFGVLCNEIGAAPGVLGQIGTEGFAGGPPRTSVPDDRFRRIRHSDPAEGGLDSDVVIVESVAEVLVESTGRFQPRFSECHVAPGWAEVKASKPKLEAAVADDPSVLRISHLPCERGCSVMEVLREALDPALVRNRIVVDERDRLALRGRPSEVSGVPESGSPVLPHDAGCESPGSQVFHDVRRVSVSLDPDDEDFPRQDGLVAQAFQTTTKSFGPLPAAYDDAQTTIHQRGCPRDGLGPTRYH